MIKAIFKNLCPNCGGDIDSDRLSLGLSCSRCFLEEGEVVKIRQVEEKLDSWERHFERNMNSKPWSLQRMWAKRVFLGRSFALLAPTGVGKTSFGISMVSYLAKEGKRAYVILPTVLLVEQVERKLLDFGLDKDEVICIGEESKRGKEEKKRRIVEGDFKVLVTTSMFLYRNYGLIPQDFEFLFVDDVDSFLKTAKNIDKALYLLGFSFEDIKTAFSLIKLRAKRDKEEDDFLRIEELSNKVKDILTKRRGVLVVSSATSNPKTKRIRLFRELLGFEVGVPTFYLRNVLDLYSGISERSLDEWINFLGKGGLIFVSSDRGRDGVRRVVEELGSKGIKAVSYEDIEDEVLKKFEEGEIDVLVGIASYRNPLARGFDMPHVVRYAIFYGVPKIVISLKFEKNVEHLLWAITSVRSYIVKRFPEYLKLIDQWIKTLKKFKDLGSEDEFKSVKIREMLDRVTREVCDFLNRNEIVKLFEESENITIKRVNGNYYLVVSDATGYLQASGRTSRMYAGGITKGVSIVLIDDKKAFNHLTRKVRWFSDDIEFKDVSLLNLGDVLMEVDEDRKRIRDYKVGVFKPELKEIFKPLLIVVESPNKARTIANFFGKPIRRRIHEHDVLETSIEDKYIMITSSLGHILDLNRREGYHGVYVDGGIKPVYEVIEGKEGIIRSLKEMALECEEVLIATDPDTEGEKIGWDIMEILKPITGKIKRMEFHEVTKRAILKAIREPRDFDLNLVRAQIVRRVADRWVGFEFSQFLQTSFKISKLSAGRVQTPVLGWLVEREREISKRVYKVRVIIDEQRRFRVEFSFNNKKEAREFYKALEYVDVEIINEEEEIRNPLPPYRTDTMLKDSSDRFRFSLPKTMEIAQTLFELGFITYHRTDSTRVSDYGINLSREYIREEFGEEYFFGRTWGDEGAHECIRPTKGIDPEDLKSLVLSGDVEGLREEHLLLYSLIFRRFIASQMRPIRVKKVKLMIKGLKREVEVEGVTEVIQDGWNKLVSLDLISKVTGRIDVRGRKELRDFPKAFPYTHGELVEEMKKKGIGRPSTYAMIIEKLLEREYVREKNNFLRPTELGVRVYGYLLRNKKAKEFLSERFTRDLESLMDRVEEGKEDYEGVLRSLYNDIIEVKKAIRSPIKRRGDNFYF